MMYDNNKKRPLKVGDAVLVPFVVTEVHVTEDYCNVQLRSTEGRLSDGNREVLTGNANVVRRNNPGDDNSDLLPAG